MDESGMIRTEMGNSIDQIFSQCLGRVMRCHPVTVRATVIGILFYMESIRDLSILNTFVSVWIRFISLGLKYLIEFSFVLCM
jgi:hypothetical protein